MKEGVARLLHRSTRIVYQVQLSTLLMFRRILFYCDSSSADAGAGV